MSHNNIGDVLLAQGDQIEALVAYRQAFATFERLAQRDPFNTGGQRDLGVSQQKIGDVLFDRGNLGDALVAYRESLDVRQQLAQRDPSNAYWQRDLWVSYWRMGNLSEQSNLPDASEWWLRAYETLSAMKQCGLFLSTEDEEFLKHLDQKIR